MLGSQIDIYLWNRLPDYFASAREAYRSLACQYLRTITLLLLWPDTGTAGRILDIIIIIIIGALHFAMETKARKIKLSFVILRTKQIVSGLNFRTLATKKEKLLQC